MKRISFNEQDAVHIYEWFVGLENEVLKRCFQCATISKRLRKFVGKKNTAWVRRIVRENPYIRVAPYKE